MHFVQILRNMRRPIIKCIIKKAKFNSFCKFDLLQSTGENIDENNKKPPLCTNLSTHLAPFAMSNPCFQSDAIEAYKPNESVRANSIGKSGNGLEYFLSQLLQKEA